MADKIFDQRSNYKAVASKALPGGKAFVQKGQVFDSRGRHVGPVNQVKRHYGEVVHGNK